MFAKVRLSKSLPFSCHFLCVSEGEPRCNNKSCCLETRRSKIQATKTASCGDVSKAVHHEEEGLQIRMLEIYKHSPDIEKHLKKLQNGEDLPQISNTQKKKKDNKEIQLQVGQSFPNTP
uniref:Uncharacterized protein n=2 Tax=Nicotiana TaxID=4085 RepID=A0A1S4BIA8_TOBAC|nr:PREDICTED: uncharacterized protein LOC104225453 [Nicotiana sylvestris]XP_016488610.1 PREDICTED: uncharacterized protein LOC107808605 [Nicotiana tabacum]